MFHQAFWRIRSISPSSKAVNASILKPARLFALLCLPYLLLSVCSPSLHTCIDEEPDTHPLKAGFPGSPGGSFESAHVWHTAKWHKPHHHRQCAACLWTKSAIGDIQVRTALSFTKTTIPFVLATRELYPSTTIHTILPRAPPIS